MNMLRIVNSSLIWLVGFSGSRIFKRIPIDTKGFQTILQLIDNTCRDSFDLFYGLYSYNPYATNQLQKIREALSKVEKQLAAKEAYLLARHENSLDQRHRLIEECRLIIREALQQKEEEEGRRRCIKRMTEEKKQSIDRDDLKTSN